MLKKVVVCVFLCLIFLFTFSQLGFAIFEKIEGVDRARIDKVSFHKLDSNLIYISSRNAIFKSKDGGNNWQKIFISKDGIIKDFCIDQQLFDTVYVASIYSVHRIDSRGVEKIFTLTPESESTSILKKQDSIYLGTTSGLYFTQGSRIKWRKVKGVSPDANVSFLEAASYSVYLLTDTQLYRADDDFEFKKIYTINNIDPELEDENMHQSGVIKVDLFNEDIVYLGLKSGFYISYDKGLTWSKLLIPAIKGVEIRGIAQTSKEKNVLYLGTDSGVYLININDKTHKLLFEGLPTKNINWIEFNHKGFIYVATNKGLFSRNQFGLLAFSSLPCELFESEPLICEVQEKALKYNSVHPDRIKKWRSNLKYRAILPKLDLDYDKTINYDSGSDRYYTGPHDWGIGLSWNLADLLWNSYEDDIDTRGRLITQLRISILDDVNAIYFERLRVKKDLIDNPDMEISEKAKKEFRLIELTAALDGYTGGYFSKRLKELSDN